MRSDWRSATLHLFYENLLDERLPFIRYPRARTRRLARWLLRRGSIRGSERGFLNLCAGLDRVGVRYTVNDYAGARRDPGAIACVFGKVHLLPKLPHAMPIVFGTSTLSHPCDDPQLFQRHNIQRMLVPCDWMRDMCLPYWGDRVHRWPVGIDTDFWAPTPTPAPDIDMLVYDKMRWPQHDAKRPVLHERLAALRRKGLNIHLLPYGGYREEDFRALLLRSRSMLFLCSHETQGVAYQQALSCGVPLLAWDPEGMWDDPDYYPHRVEYGPVSSVPYWDKRCGMKHVGFTDTLDAIESFLPVAKTGRFNPRQYIVETLTLEGCAAAYVEHIHDVRRALHDGQDRPPGTHEEARAKERT